MGRRRKTADDWVVEYPDFDVIKRPRRSSDRASTSSTSADDTTLTHSLCCKYCAVEISPEPDKKPYDRLREHVASKRHLKLKADAEEAERKQRQQPTLADTIVRQREREKQGEGIIHDFVRALSYDGLSLEHADSELGKFVKTYCPAAKTMPTARQLRDKHLRDVFLQHKAALTAKVAHMKVGIIVDESADVTGKPTVNILFSYYDESRKTKAVNLFDVSCVKATNSVTISNALSNALENYGKSWHDVIAISSDSAEYMRRAVKDIREAEGVNIVHVKDLPHLLHVAVSKALLLDSISDIREVVIKFGALFKHANRLFQQYHQICLANGLSASDVKKPPAVVPVRWLSFYRTLVTVTEMWDCLTQLVEQDTTTAKATVLQNIMGSNKGMLYAKAICLQEKLKGISDISEKLETGKILLHQYYDLVHVELSRALDEIKSGIAVNPGSNIKAVMAMLPKPVSDTVKAHINSFCTALVNKWEATCLRNLTELEMHQVTQLEMWRKAKILDPFQKHLMDNAFDEYRELFLLCTSELDLLQEEFLLYMKEDFPANKDIDILTFWDKCDKYPNLRSVALNLLCMPTGSCDVERSFSSSPAGPPDQQ